MKLNCVDHHIESMIIERWMVRFLLKLKNVSFVPKIQLILEIQKCNYVKI